MKTYSGFLLALISLLTLTTCQKEDVYNPKDKLLSIYDYEQEDKAPYVSFIYDNNNLTIKKVVFLDNSEFHLTYNEEKQVIKISGYANNLPYGYVIMEYIDEKLSKATYYNNPGEIFQKDTFFRQNGTIYGFKTYISNTTNKSLEEISKNFRLFRTYMHPHQPKNIETILKQSKSGLVLVSHTNVAYSDKNISQIETVYNNGFTTLFKFTYDDNRNPLYGLPFALVDLLNFPSSPLVSYSKNNFISYSYSEYFEIPGEVNTINYDLIYQKNKYPTHIFSTVGYQTKLRWEFIYQNM